MIIKTFDIIEDAIQFVMDEEYNSEDYFKAEVFRTDDGRWRVGIITNPQLEMDI